MAKIITITALMINNVDFGYTGCAKKVSCDNMNVIGDYWATPVQDPNGNFLGFTYTSSVGGVAKPTADSFRAVKFTSGSNNVIAAIAEFQADGSTPNTSQILFDGCDQCCGDTPLVITTIIPTPVLEQKACYVSDTASADFGTYVVKLVVPKDDGTYTYSASFNKLDATTGASTANGSTIAQTAATSALVASQLNGQFNSAGSVVAIGASSTFITEDTASTSLLEGVLKLKSTSPFTVSLTITSA